MHVTSTIQHKLLYPSGPDALTCQEAWRWSVRALFSRAKQLCSAYCCPFGNCQHDESASHHVACHAHKQSLHHLLPNAIELIEQVGSNNCYGAHLMELSMLTFEIYSMPIRYDSWLSSLLVAIAKVASPWLKEMVLYLSTGQLMVHHPKNSGYSGCQWHSNLREAWVTG